MKILFTIDRLGSGGKERRLTELLKMLKSDSNIEFELLIMDTYIHYREIFDLEINIHYVIRRIKKDPVVFYDCYKICRAFKPDFVHCWDGMTAFYMIPACKMLGIKLLNGMVTNAPEKLNIFTKNGMYAKLTFPFSDAILGNSLAGLAAYKAPKNKSYCIYNGFNFNRTAHLLDGGKIKESLHIHTPYVIGMVASFSLKKDYKTYFEAAQLLLKKRNDLTFIAIGKDTDSPPSLDLIQNEYMKHFRLLGEKNEIESFINIMDICVLCTFTEAVSNSVLEYMAEGKPVIVTDGGGTNEIVVDRGTGYLIRQSDPGELAEKIEVLLNDKDLRLRMGDSGKRVIRNKFSIEKMLSSYISIYESNSRKRT